MTTPKTTEEKCWAITASFEGCGYTGLTGNFDGQGWSWGLLSWALGQGTLQPLILACHEAGPETFRRCCTVDVPNLGETDLSEQLLATCRKPVAEAVASAAERCDAGKRPLEHWRRVFENLGSEPGFQAVQRAHGRSYMDHARAIFAELGFKTERGLALCFDIAVQDGGVKAEARAAFEREAPSGPEEQRLVALAEAVASCAVPAFQDDVRSRKLCVATGRGHVHGRDYDLERDFGLTFGPVVEAEG